MMIPSNIHKRHVELALTEIDRRGVPDGRASRRFLLHSREQTYPPKYVVSLANQFANGRVLQADEFSGGAETNAFLCSLGYEIRSKDSSTPKSAGKLAVATVLLEATRRYNLARRLESMRFILDAAEVEIEGPTLFVFPGGWLRAPSSEPVDAVFDATVGKVLELIHVHKHFSVSFGLDGSRYRGFTRDQLAVAITGNHILAVGRKFHPAPGEANEIYIEENWNDGERSYPRIAEIGGKRFFLAICYDGFGIKHRKLPRPKVDAVLDHVHHFGPGESEVLFARHGFAGAAQQWRVPVFGAAVFFDRPIPPSWPSGVRWKGPRRSTMEWSYRDNPLQPVRTLTVNVSEGRAVIRLFQT